MIRKILARTREKTILKSFKAVDQLLKTDFYWRRYMKNNGYHVSDYLFDKDQIAFVHLPKTGGTSFYKTLNHQNENAFVNLNIHRPISHLCPVGAFKYVTILRDPVERVWSYYQMVLRNPAGYPYREFTGQGLECFLQKCWAASNMYCQYYTGLVYQKVDEVMLEQAIANLEKFYAVLSFENFNLDTRTFLKQHNMTITEIPHERKHAYAAPTPKEKELIGKYNQFDIELFNQWTLKKNK